MNKCEALKWLVDNVKVWPSEDNYIDAATPNCWHFNYCVDEGFVSLYESGLHIWRSNNEVTEKEWLDAQPHSDSEGVFLDCPEISMEKEKVELRKIVDGPKTVEILNDGLAKGGKIEASIGYIIGECGSPSILIKPKPPLKHVIIESPYAGDIDDNITYARKCMRDSLLRGEAPYASHLLYTQKDILDDSIPEERDLGILAGFAWKHIPDVITAFYADRGFSKGMRQAIDYCQKHDKPYEIRFLEGV